MIPKDISPGHRIFTIFSIVVSGLILLVVVGGFFLVRALMDNWMLKQDAKDYAGEAGYAQARSDFANGRRQLVELYLYDTSADDFSGKVPDEGTIVATGRREGDFEIRHFMVSKNYPAIHREVQAAYVEGYNRHMRFMHDRPEWFVTNGFRVARPNRAMAGTNAGAKPTSQ